MIHLTKLRFGFFD